MSKRANKKEGYIDNAKEVAYKRYKEVRNRSQSWCFSENGKSRTFNDY